MQHDCLASNSLGAQLAACSMPSCWHFDLTFRGIPCLESSLYFSYILFLKLFYSRTETFVDPDTILKAAVSITLSQDRELVFGSPVALLVYCGHGSCFSLGPCVDSGSGGPAQQPG